MVRGRHSAHAQMHSFVTTHLPALEKPAEGWDTTLEILCWIRNADTQTEFQERQGRNIRVSERLKEDDVTRGLASTFVKLTRFKLPVAL